MQTVDVENIKSSREHTRRVRSSPVRQEVMQDPLLRKGHLHLRSNKAMRHAGRQQLHGIDLSNVDDTYDMDFEQS